MHSPQISQGICKAHRVLKNWVEFRRVCFDGKKKNNTGGKLDSDIKGYVIQLNSNYSVSW